MPDRDWLSHRALRGTGLALAALFLGAADQHRQDRPPEAKSEAHRSQGYATKAKPPTAPVHQQGPAADASKDAHSPAHEERFGGVSNEGWIAVFTFVLTVATCILAASTIALWLATRRLWQGAERALDTLERPVLTVKVLNQPSADQPFGGDFDFAFVNHGRIPAFVVRTGRMYQVADTPPSPVDPKTQGLDMEEGFVVGPGEPSEPLIAKKHGTFGTTYFHGYVLYEDFFGSRYITGWYYRYSTRARRLTPFSPPDENPKHCNYFRKLGPAETITSPHGDAPSNGAVSEA